MDQGDGAEGVSVVDYNHIVCVPGKFEDGSFHFGRSRINSSHTTSGAYLGSEMYTTTIGPVTNSGSTAANATINQQLYAEFGSHLKTTREVSANSIVPGYSNNLGGASNGASSL